jgi:hypothetical protein
MPLSDIRAYVTRLSPTQFDTATANAIVNDAYLQVARRRPWKFLEKQIPLFTSTIYATGTVSLTAGSATVTGSGTTFTAAMVGKYLQVGSRQPIRVTAYTSATSITIAANWGEANVSGAAYSIIQLRFALPSDADRVVRLVGPLWELQRKDLTLIDAIDPYRSMTGPPLVFCEVANYGPGSKEIEIWPIPNTADTYTLTYRVQVPVLVSDSDVPYLSEDIIAALAQSMACGILAGRTGDQMWLALIDKYALAHQQMYEAMVVEDQRMKGSLPVWLDSDDIMTGYTDPMFAKWYMMWQQFSMTKVA